MLVKRSMDYVGAVVGLLLLSPLMALIAVLIRLDSRGPTLFSQERMGLGGRTFRMYKFRTMTTDAEQRLKELESLNESDGDVLFKMRRDPRVTRVGRFLRRTSLDELPQLFNVFRGEMSQVGPRPLQLRDCALLEKADPAGYEKRLRVQPGVTGLWQVMGRSDASYRKMLELDSYYVDRWSVSMDLGIVLRTVGVVLTSKGAY